jgi:hypothetical protein
LNTTIRIRISTTKALSSRWGEKQIKRPAPERAKASRLGNATPEILQGRACASGPAFRVAIDQHRSIHCAGRQIRSDD